jgi:hypothetical protein
MSSEEYISGLVNFITTASLNDTIVTHLLDKFKQDNPLPPG